MSIPLTDSPLANYIHHYGEVARLNMMRSFTAPIALIAFVAIGAIAYGALSTGALPFGFGMSGNLAAAAMAGTFVAGIATIGILNHYGRKITEAYRESGEERFLDALMHPSTADVFKECKEGRYSEVGVRFLYMLNSCFPDENWQGMMHYFDQRFFHSEGVTYDPNTIAQVYRTFFLADPMRFMKNYSEMKAENQLSDECMAFVDPLCQETLQNIPTERWAESILRIDRAYFSKTHPSNAIATCTLLKLMAQQDPKQFINAYVAVMSQCSNAFLCQVEEEIIFREPFMTAAGDELYGLGSRLLLRYCELQAERKLPAEVSASFDAKIQDILTRAKDENWANLIGALDTIYFRKTARYSDQTKANLLQSLLQFDSDTFERRYLPIRGQLSSHFRRWVDFNFERRKAR
jgi:hypothetical protein